MPAEPGNCTTVLSAMTQNVPTNAAVVHGCPGTLNADLDSAAPRANPAFARRRKTISAAPARPKNSASIATS